LSIVPAVYKRSVKESAFAELGEVGNVQSGEFFHYSILLLSVVYPIILGLLTFFSRYDY
jgi:hypothetical protein